MSSERKIDAIIPARIGSKRIFKKNLALVGVHPLIEYSIVACLRSFRINRVIVSTDSKEIASIAVGLGADVPFIRPRDFAKDSSSDFGFLKHFFENINCSEVALIRPTTPHRNPYILDGVVDKYFENKDKNITGLRTMNTCKMSPYKLFALDESNICNGLFSDFNGEIDYSNLPNQVFPKIYEPNGYIDIVRYDTIKSGSVFGERIFGILTPEVVDIDTQFDLDLVNMQVGTKYDFLRI